MNNPVAGTYTDTIKPASKILVSLIPVTPVAFSGEDAVYAWLRLIGYSAAAYFTFSKARKLSYIAMTAAGLSLATSLGAGVWKNYGRTK